MDLVVKGLEGLAFKQVRPHHLQGGHITGCWSGRWTGANQKIGQEPGATYQGESGICLPENIFIILYFLYLRARNYKITSGNNQGCVREQPCTLVKVYC